MTDASLSTGDVTGGTPVVGSPAYKIVYNLSTTAAVGGEAVVGSPELAFDSGQRWPLRPNWDSDVEETYEFRTDIIALRSGAEQRRALRINPRKQWQYKALVSADGFRAAARFITGRYDQMAYAPNLLTYVYTTTDLSAGGNSFDVASVPDWLIAGAICELSYGDGTYALVLVKGVGGTSVTIYGTANVTYPAGAKLRPTDAVRINAGTRPSMATRGVAQYQVVLDVDPGSLWLPDTTAAPATFNGREIFDKKPNWANGVDVTYSSMREMVDYDQGRVASYALSTFMTRDWQGAFVGRGKEEVQYVTDFFRRMKGRQGEFYVETGTADLSPIANLTSGTATMKTAGSLDYGAHAAGDKTSSRLVDKAVFVRLRDGSYMANTISNVGLSGSDTLFTLGSNWSQTVTPDAISYVSYMPVCRFGSDSLTIQWLTNGVAQFTLPFHTLESLDPDE